MHRSHTAKLVFDLLDDIHALQVRRAPPIALKQWAQRARAGLRRLIGDQST
jgi:hypothetical protein